MVDVRHGRLQADRLVAIEDGIVCAVLEAESPEVTAARITLDGHGRYLIPGLMEMLGHVGHFDARESLSLNLTNGVTTVRNMWGEPWTLELRRELEETHKGEYPRLVTAGPIIDGAPPLNYPFEVVTDPRQADAAVARQAALGYDFVKIYSNLSPSVFDAIMRAGDKYGIEISGHLPHDVSLPHALDAGMRTMEHFLEVADELLVYPPGPDFDLYVMYAETRELLAAITRAAASSRRPPRNSRAGALTLSRTIGSRQRVFM